MASTAALNTIKKRHPTLVILFKKKYDIKLSDIEAKYPTTSGYKKFTNEILDSKIKKELVDKSYIFLGL